MRRALVLAAAAFFEYLRKVPIFEGLPPRELEFISRSVKERIYEPGMVIVKQGDTGVGIFMVVEGRVEVTHDGHKFLETGPGAFFGETAPMEERIRTATVTAKTKVRCLHLPGDAPGAITRSSHAPEPPRPTAKRFNPEASPLKRKPSC